MEELPMELPHLKESEKKCHCIGHEKIKPDNRLLAWEKNLQLARNVRRHLCRTTGRSENDLLMNTLDHHRAIQEHRMLLTYAKVPCTFDKYRGNPAFWKMPPQLYKQCDEPQNYYFQLSKLQRNEIPSFSFVNVPDSDYKAKSRRVPAKSLTDLNEVSLKIIGDPCTLHKIQPHKPDFKDIIIKGHGLRPTYAMDILDYFRSTRSYDALCGTNEDDSSSGPTKAQVPNVQSILIVNDLKITSQSSGTIISNVGFNLICQNVTQTHYLFLQNCSKISLRIAFTETQVKSDYASTRNTAEKSDEQVFYFNRNYQILQGCQKVNVPFWFKSNKCGQFDMAVQMSIVPDLWDGKLNLVLHLKATTYEKGAILKINQYEELIQNRIRGRMIEECLSYMLKQIPPKKYDLKVYHYDRATIFEAINSKYDAMHDRSKYLYDKKIVDELEAFYESVRLPRHAELWSLNLNDLRAVTKEREVFEQAKNMEVNLEQILETIEKNKEAREEALQKIEKMWAAADKSKSAKPGTSTAASPNKGGPTQGQKGKSEAVRGRPKEGDKKGGPGKVQKVMTEPDYGEAPLTLSAHLEKIIAQLKSPRIVKDDQSDKLKVGYNLLCAYIDRICTDIKVMSLNNFAVRPDPMAVQINLFNPARIRGEHSNTCDWEMPAFQELVEPKYAKPQPSWSVLPFSQYDARFKAHQGIAGGDDKKSKKGAKSLTSKKSDVTSSQSKKDLPPESNRPSTHASIDVEEISDHSFHELFVIPEEKLDHYKNNIYVLFYTHLCNFVDDLETVFDLLPRSELSPVIVQKTYETQTIQQKENTQLRMEVLNVRKTISEALKWNVREEREVPREWSSLKVVERPLPMERSSSIFEVMKGYQPRRGKMVPKESDDAVTTNLRTMAMMGEEKEEEEEETSEASLRDQSLQTSICSDVSVSFAPLLASVGVKKKAICVCPKIDRYPCRIPKLVSSFHNSECASAKSSSPSSIDSGTSTSDDD